MKGCSVAGARAHAASEACVLLAVMTVGINVFRGKRKRKSDIFYGTLRHRVTFFKEHVCCNAQGSRRFLEPFPTVGS